MALFCFKNYKTKKKRLYSKQTLFHNGFLTVDDLCGTREDKFRLEMNFQLNN